MGPFRLACRASLSAETFIVEWRKRKWPDSRVNFNRHEGDRFWTIIVQLVIMNNLFPNHYLYDPIRFGSTIRNIWTIVYLTGEYHLHLLYPPSVWESSIDSSFYSSSFTTFNPYSRPRYHIHTSSWIFFGTETAWRQLRRPLRSTMFLTG
jgi:hypothetical protein